MPHSNKNAYRLREMLPRSGEGVTIDAVLPDMQMSYGGIYSLLKTMQAHGLAKCSEVSAGRRKRGAWWACGKDNAMPEVFGPMIMTDSDPDEQSNFGRYASVWDYGQGRVY